MTRQEQRVRAGLSGLLLGADLSNIALTMANVHGPARFVLGLALGLLVPGWSLIGLLKLGDVALEVSLAIATSLALLLIGAQVLVALGAWHLGGFEIGVCLACLPSLAWQSWPPATTARSVK
ncbi:MAG: hypothetical protein ACHQFZ_08330 [Acidimicrobiales bacterium]